MITFSRILQFFVYSLAIIALIFYAPIIILSFLKKRIAGLLYKSAIKKVGHPYYGYRSKIAGQLYKDSIVSIEEAIINTVAFATKERRSEIMKAIDINEVYEYVTKDEREVDENERTIFLCKFLDCKTAADLGDKVYDVSGVGSTRKERLRTGSQQLFILKNFMVGWKNFKDANGEDVVFDSKNMTEMIDKIPLPCQREIVDFIRNESEVEEGEDQS